VRQHDLSFANFVLRFGIEEVLLDHAEDIVIPAFLDSTHVRKFGDTTFRFYDVKFTKIADEGKIPVLALSGHFVKDTVLKRQQIFRQGRGLVEDQAEIESAPSSYFVLILNYHRILYFAETAAAPPLEAFATTAQHFLRLEHQSYLSRRRERENVTRRGVERITFDQLKKRVPPPVLTVIPVAGQELISEIVERFRKIKQIRFKLVEPNDELDASAAVAAIEQTFRPLRPKRLELIASDPQGLDKGEAAKKIIEASEGHNTEILIDGEDKAGLAMKVDNEQFALSVPIEEPPANDAALRALLVQTYDNLVHEDKVRRLPTPAAAVEKLARLVGLL
jgi:hypothetical protein